MLNTWTLVAVILALSVVLFIVLIAGIGHFGIRTKYWDRQFGSSRTWDMGNLGKAVLTYQLNPEDSTSVEMELALHQHDGSTQKTSWSCPRTQRNEREVYGLYIEAHEKWVRDEARELAGYRTKTLRELGVRPRLKLISG